ncbi:NRDE family protein [Azospira restricta]|uniref:NRDE family protein n=1 Tax=Azospira restricta TaxID=404405 RepID=A0A974PX46_9RHOO|nr:NRDE family protein [Azospira restricta]QRJ62778.1 NRDE family protein [Azospira restricta]
MCLILVAWRAHPDYPLVVAANRDEFFARPTASAARWADAPQVLAGRDLEAGGTWLGVAAGGRFAAVTNVREPGRPQGARSRGRLTADFLTGDASAAEYAAAIDGAAYSGFNLLVSDGRALWYASNRIAAPHPLSPGIYGVSNHLLDTPWPKLATAKARFAAALPRLPAEEDFFALLADDEIVPDRHLPATGVSLEWERRLSAIFVRSSDYGTRASTLLVQRDDGGARLHERSYGSGGEPAGEICLDLG